MPKRSKNHRFDKSISWLKEDRIFARFIVAAMAMGLGVHAAIALRVRRSLPGNQLKIVRDFVSSGKPVIGIRTASHAFSLRGKPAPAEHASPEEFDSFPEATTTVTTGTN